MRRLRKTRHRVDRINVHKYLSDDEEYKKDPKDDMQDFYRQLVEEYEAVL